MIVDAYRVLDLLAKHPRIDPAKVAVMGSRAVGGVALYASLRRFQRPMPPPEMNSRGYWRSMLTVAPKYRGDDDVSDKPIRLFHGTADDYVPVRRVGLLLNGCAPRGKDILLTEYANAWHVSTAPLLQSPSALQRHRIGRIASEKSLPMEKVVNLETGQPFTFKDSCVVPGATIAYDAEGS